MDDLRMEDLRRKINFAIDEAYNRGWQQGRNNVKPLIDEIHENVYNEGYNKGRADERKEMIQKVTEILSLEIADCKNCPINCEVATYGSCQEEIKKYLISQIGE